MRFIFIAAHTEEFHVTTMCRVLEVKRAGYYAWVNRPPSARAMEDAQLAETIKEIHDTSRRTYGSPRVHEELKAQGQQHGEKRGCADHSGGRVARQSAATIPSDDRFQARASDRAQCARPAVCRGGRRRA